MALDDYLAKHYGPAASGKKRKAKQQQRSEPAPRGQSLVINDDGDDDRVHAPRPAEAKETRAPAPRPRFKDTGSSWRAVGPAAPVDEALADGAALAEGADLVLEYRAQQQQQQQQQRQREQEEAEAAERQQQQQQQKRQKEAQGGTAAREPSPEAAPMRYGLQTAQTIKEDAARAHEQRMRRLRELGDDASGRAAETVYRDAKTGKRIDVEAARQDARDEARRRERLAGLHAEWNKGLVQQRQRLEEQRQLDAMRDPDADRARRAELDADQRARQHWDDPALRFLAAKPAAATAASAYPAYRGHAPPNRFGIRPGHRWDGVDRSNGFERELFRRQAAADAQKSQAYSHSVADW
ncbi:Pre-mRNA-splicing factor cwc26 [Coemansia javaensis]|uniref:Pre-mRNA-splicing factor cwc26 n=1 Tax=Coemansia javaensis TaxID=2761396 RepID=A0A9W8LMI2_9FUNG|nr:Pre-mRNA-splicing factor cwc26 [Coemansia javaensis]